VAVLLLALALVAAPPSAALSSRPAATVGQPWRTTLVVRNAAPASVAVTATSSARTIGTRARRASRGRYAVRLVFPGAGRWTLTARFGGRRYPLGAVTANAPQYRFDRPNTMIAERDGTLLLAEGGPQHVMRIDPATGRTTVVARGFGNPFGIARLPDGDLVVSSNDSIFRVDAQSGQRETLATYPAPIEAGPLAVDSTGLVYVATTDHRITRINPATRAVEVVAGTGASGSSGDGGPALAATMTVPHGLLLESDTSLLIADTDNDRIRRLDLRAGVITTVASGVSGVAMLARAADGSLLASELRGNEVVRIAADGGRTTAARLAANPWSIAVTPDGTLYVIDSLGATLNRVAPNGEVTRVRVVAPA
jgi:sugar lactone lactonase YvrE